MQVSEPALGKCKLSSSLVPSKLIRGPHKCRFAVLTAIFLLKYILIKYI